MTVFELLSIAIACMGGAWALVERHASLQRRLEDQETTHFQQTIARLERLAEILGRKID